jgi:hypothetical protein
MLVHAFVPILVLFLTGVAYAQVKISPAPRGDEKQIASAAIKNAEHPCGRVLDAIRLQDNSVRAMCSNGEAYRVFSLQGEVVAMKCSAAKRLGVGGC